MNKIALISGISGQDGSYLAEFLLHQGYEVHGIVRRSSSQELSLHRIRHILDKVTLHEGDITDAGFIHDLMDYEVQPDEVYNLAAQSHVHTSFDVPEYTFQVNTLGLMNILNTPHAGYCKIYQASTSEMFGGQGSHVYYNEDSKFNPRSPYAVSKVAAHQLAEMYRHRAFVSCGIMFNHESPRRGDNFVTKKIAVAAAKAYLNIPYKLELGNLDAVRDWGFAPDYVEVMWKMLQQDRPETYVIGTGESYTVRNFINKATDWIEKPIIFTTSNKLLRPLEVDYLQCKPAKAKDILGWEATTNFYELVELMVDAEIERLLPEENDARGHKYFKENYGSIYRWL